MGRVFQVEDSAGAKTWRHAGVGEWEKDDMWVQLERGQERGLPWHRGLLGSRLRH